MTITTTSSSSLDTTRRSVTTRRLSVVAGVLWLGVAASTAAWWDETSADWRLWYGMFSLLLGSAAAMTAAAAISAAWRGSTERMETPGVAFTVIAVCTTVISFALPLWMVSIAAGYAVFAIEAREHRRALVLLAVAQLAGLAVMLAGDAVGVGPSDEWGGHPVADSAAIATTALLTAVALILLARGPRRSASAR